MKFEKIHNKGRAQLFQNKYLELLTRSHPLIIWGMYIPVITGLLYYGITEYQYLPWQIVLTFISGMFAWTFFEYIMHRYLFHMIADSPRAQKFIYIMHGNHHHFPRDRERLFMPPLPSLLIACVFYLVFKLTMGDYVYFFLPGFVLGYLLYGSMHYAIHAFNPPFKWMKPLWRNHHLHHYKDEHKGYGVSTTIWDRVFGTMFDLSKEKEDKEKVQELMYHSEKQHQ